MTTLVLEQLANELQLTFAGDGGTRISGVATLKQATSEHIAFYDNAKYHDDLLKTQAGVVILHPKFAKDTTVNQLHSDNPYLTFAKVARLFDTKAQRFKGVHPSAVLSDSVTLAKDVVIAPNAVIGDAVTLGAGVIIGPNVVIGNQVTIGDGTELKANVTICDQVTIGERCLVHPGAVIGCDGFGNARDGNAWVKVPQLGGVIIGNDVEIGANTTIDCGAIDSTQIADGARLDNLIQIAHNVHIGKHTAIAACTGVAGSTQIGDNCMIGGNVGINGHIHIADGVMITGMTMVTKSLTEPGVYSSGVPVADSRTWRKNAVRFAQLDDMAKRLKALEKDEKQ